LRDILYEKHNSVNKEDFNLYTITDDEEEIIKIVKSAPLRRE